MWATFMVAEAGLSSGTDTGFGIQDLLQRSTIKAKFRPLGLNWDFFGTIFGPFWDFVVIFTKMKEKTCKKGKKRCHDISHVKKYI